MAAVIGRCERGSDHAIPRHEYVLAAAGRVLQRLGDARIHPIAGHQCVQQRGTRRGLHVYGRDHHLEQFIALLYEARGLLGKLRARRAHHRQVVVGREGSRLAQARHHTALPVRDQEKRIFLAKLWTTVRRPCRGWWLHLRCRTRPARRTWCSGFR